jgi:hypothetical protein
LGGYITQHIVHPLILRWVFAVGTQKERSCVATKVLGDGLNERTQNEGEVIAGVEAVPEGGGAEGGKGGAETGFFTSRSDTQVDVVAQPFVGVFVPVVEVGAGVLGGF